MNVVYPPELDRNVIALEAPGGVPASLDVVVPSIIRPGEPFDVRLAVLDAVGYPSMEADVAVRLP